jgi:RHS repeat-associated protein
LPWCGPIALDGLAWPHINAPVATVYDAGGSVRDLLANHEAPSDLFTFAGDADGGNDVTPGPFNPVGSQRADYDAFGALILFGLSNTTGLNTRLSQREAAITGLEQALISHLTYRGEQFDTHLRMQYLRARHYDQATGRFTRLDPFPGLRTMPQALNRYAYTHGDPLNFTDPSGEFEFTLGQLLATMGIRVPIEGVDKGSKIALKKTAQLLLEEMRDVYDFRDPRPVPRVARAAESLWVHRLRELGMYVIPMQNTAVGSHGPDVLAFAQNRGRLHLVVGEVKGTKANRRLSLLHKTQDRGTQMSAQWIDSYLSPLAETIIEELVDAAASIITGPVKTLIREGLGRMDWDVFLLRARYFSTPNTWQLKGFRLLSDGPDQGHVRLDPDQERIFAEVTSYHVNQEGGVASPPGFRL